MDTSETYIKMCQEAFPEDARKGQCLKTQDQLQEMVEPHKGERRSRVLQLTERLAGFCAVHAISGLTSMEQVWLVFVMKEKHNKTWNGERWE